MVILIVVSHFFGVFFVSQMSLFVKNDILQWLFVGWFADLMIKCYIIKREGFEEEIKEHTGVPLLKL